MICSFHIKKKRRYPLTCWWLCNSIHRLSLDIQGSLQTKFRRRAWELLALKIPCFSFFVWTEAKIGKTLACFRVWDSRVRGDRSRKREHELKPFASRLPYYLRAWNGLERRLRSQVGLWPRNEACKRLLHFKIFEEDNVNTMWLLKKNGNKVVQESSQENDMIKSSLAIMLWLSPRKRKSEMGCKNVHLNCFGCFSFC